MMTRDTIIKHLSTNLKKNPKVFAFWLEGADAHKRTDKYSDIDIWIDVADKYETKIFATIKNLLSELGKIDFSHETHHPHPKIRQKFFHLNNTSEFLIIDICVQSHSRVFWYTKGLKDEKVKIVFDKNRVITFKPLNKKELKQNIVLRTKELAKTFLFFQVWIRKEIKRNHFLEALNSYHKKVLQPLVELLRIKYQPTKKDFYLTGIFGDIPRERYQQLVNLYKITSTTELKKKLKQANELFFDILQILNSQNLK